MLELPAPLQGPTAFELVTTLDGASLVYAQADESASLFVQHLDRNGKVKGPPVLVLEGTGVLDDISDLTAARLDSALAVAWVGRYAAEARAHAVFFDGREQPDVIDLGSAFNTHKPVRGNIALAATREFALAFVRGRPEACAEGEAGCFGFSLRKLDENGVASARGLPLVVPVPCAAHSTSLSVVDGRWHYAVCTLEQTEPVTTVFSIQFSPEYAKAEQYLRGCRPLGLFEHEDSVWLSADCVSGRRLSRVHEGPQREHDLSGAKLRCESGSLVLSAGAFNIKFKRSMGQAHALLGSPWVSESSRAVWTGRVLLVANPVRQGLSLVGYRCQK